MKFANMMLYYKPACPYCQKVITFMEDNGIAMEMRNTLDENNREELISLTGKTQVPCLVVGGDPMLESDAIIAYLAGAAAAGANE